MAYKNLLFDKKDKVGIITINQPKKLNAVDSATMGEIKAAVGEIESDTDISVGIITGAGDKAFVAGADLAEFENMGTLEIAEYCQVNQSIYDYMESIGKPIIAAVNGLALGGGTELAMACTFRILSEKAKMGLPELGIGALPAAGGIQRLVRLAGKADALWMLLTGEMVNAQEAFRIGLANKVVPHDQLMDSCFKLAKTIQTKGPFAVKMALTSVRIGSNVDQNTANSLDLGLVGLCFATEDKKEGIKAILEKRAPQFKGK